MVDKKVVVRFLVPINEDERFGNGLQHPYYKWENLVDEIFKRFRGWTLDPVLKHGCYPDEVTEKPIFDESREYTVDVEEVKIPEFKAFIKEYVTKTFCQACIRIEIRGESELIYREYFEE